MYKLVNSHKTVLDSFIWQFKADFDPNTEMK